MNSVFRRTQPPMVLLHIPISAGSFGTANFSINSELDMICVYYMWAEVQRDPNPTIYTRYQCAPADGGKLTAIFDPAQGTYESLMYRSIPSGCTASSNLIENNDLSQERNYGYLSW